MDFHAEVTSEKMAMGWYLDGRVSAVVGTHTHVPTADTRILPGGTAYQTDCGMTGPYRSVIGVETEIILQRFLTGLPVRMEAASAGRELHSVIVDVDEDDRQGARHSAPRDQRRLSGWTPPARLPTSRRFTSRKSARVLFGMVFLFLYRQSKVVYFGLWAVAWGMRVLATFFGFQLLRTQPLGVAGALRHVRVRVCHRADLGGARRLCLQREGLAHGAAPDLDSADLRGAGVGASASSRAWRRTTLRTRWCWASSTSTTSSRCARAPGVGARIFRFSLLVLAAAFFEHAIILLYLFNRGGAPAWAVYLHHETYYDFALHCVLAFAAMAMWSESQIDRMRDLTGELDHLRRERKHTMDLDRLTGLLNQAALSQRVEDPAGFEGVVVVCDMDNFKDINDRYGHLVGDEILRNIGNLLQSSIRHEDEAFRWGGDEFVILFRNQRTDVAVRRMADIESRLRDFRVRGLGILPITLQLGDGRYAGPRAARCAGRSRPEYVRREARARGGRRRRASGRGSGRCPAKSGGT